MSTQITAFYAGLLAALYVYLSVMVINQRRKLKIGLGDGGDKGMMQAMRVHGNFVEYVPFALVLMLIAEINNTQHLWLHVAGTGLIIARLLHAHGVRNSAGVSWQRAVGVVSTFLIFIQLIVLNLLTVY